jgi:hypothetical protein
LRTFENFASKHWVLNYKKMGISISSGILDISTRNWTILGISLGKNPGLQHTHGSPWVAVERCCGLQLSISLQGRGAAWCCREKSGPWDLGKGKTMGKPWEL